MATEPSDRMPLVIGVDASTTAVKALVFDASGAVVSAGRSPLSLERPRPGWHEQGPRSWWDATRSAIREAVGEMPDPRLVRAIGITHQRESFACLDADGEPLRPAPLWVDGRAGAEVVEFGNDRVHEVSGKPPDVTPALYKLLWLRRHEPSVLERASWVVDVHAYLVHALTGRWATSWPAADPLGLMDMRSRAWSPELLELVGIGAERLPALEPPGAVLGSLRPAVAEDLGLASSVAVVAGGGDGQVAGLGADATDPGTAYLNLGTAVVAGVGLTEYRWARAFRTMSGATPDTYVAETLLSSGAYLVGWFVEQLGGQPLGTPPDPKLQAEAARIGPGADGLLTLPYWNCAQTPHWDPFASGATIGWRGSHGPAHLYRSLLEGVAFELRLQWNGVGVELGHPVERFLAVGGGAKSPLWSQIVADVTGVPVTACREPETSALGAAALAAAATGLHPSIAGAARAMAAYDETYEPRADAMAVYDELYAVYERLYPRLAETFAALEAARSGRTT